MLRPHLSQTHQSLVIDDRYQYSVRPSDRRQPKFRAPYLSAVAFSPDLPRANAAINGRTQITRSAS